MDVSIVIPTYNRAKQALGLIEYICNLLKFKGQIILVDQSGENTDTKIALSKYPNVIHYFQNEKGTSKARNFGANHTDTEWLCFLDDDVHPVGNFFEQALIFLNDNQWVDVLQPELLQRESWNEYLSFPSEWMENFKSARKNLREFPARKLDAVQWFLQKPNTNYGTLSFCIGAGAFFIKRDAFLRVGGFDENFRGSGDDRDLVVRLWWWGYRVYYHPEIIAFHLHEESGGLRAQKAKSLFLNIIRPDPDPGMVYFYKKWFPGYPEFSFYIYHFLKKGFLSAPSRLFRLIISIRLAKALIQIGPHYINGSRPQSREAP
jgi:GT2 family glycosyltransferase